MNVEIKAVLSQYLDTYQDNFKLGYAFIGENNLGLELDQYINLITIVNKLGISFPAAQAGFKVLYDETQNRASIDPPLAAWGELNRVRFFLQKKSPQVALRTARRIKPPATFTNPYGLKEHDVDRQVMRGQMMAYEEIAEYYLLSGRTDLVLNLIEELAAQTPVVRYKGLCEILFEYYLANHQPEEAHQIAVFLEMVSHKEDKINHDYDPLLTVLLKVRIEEMKRGQSRAVANPTYLQLLDWEPNETFKVQGPKLHTLLQNQLASSKGSYHLQGSIDNTVLSLLSACHYLTQPEDWDQNFSFLSGLLNIVRQYFYHQPTITSHDDFTPGSSPNSALKHYKPNPEGQSLTIIGNRPDRSLNQRQQYYQLGKKALAESALKFGDTTRFPEIIDQHFSLTELVQLYHSPQLLALLSQP